MKIWKNRTLPTKVLVVGFIMSLAILLINSWITIPLGIILAIIIPGILVLASTGYEIRINWSTAILGVALGVTSFTFLALAVNMTGVFFGSTHPLSLISLVVANYSLIALLCIFRTKWNIKNGIFPVLSRLEKIVIVLSLFILAGFVVGAALLNNGATGWLSLFCFLSIPVLLFILFWKHAVLNRNVIITSLWLLSLGLLLSGWLRSWYVSGPDVSLEFKLAETVTLHGLWSTDTIRHAYNSCLSVSLLAPAISIITKSSLALTFKLIIPLLYSLVVPTVYLIAERFFKKRGAIIASAFFMAQPVFVVWWWIPIRQQIAFLLFGALLFLIVKVAERSRRVLLLLLFLSLGLVVAHYTTALIAIAYFAIVWIVSAIISRSKRLGSFKSPVPFVLVILLGVAYFIWYAQLTYGFNGVTQFAGKSLEGITSIFSEGKRIPSSSVHPEESFAEYENTRSRAIREAYGEKNMYPEKDTAAYTPQKMEPEEQNDATLEVVRQVFIAASKAVVIAGVIMGLWLAVKRKELRKYALLSASALGMLGITAVLPSFSVSYDLVRTYQQLLFVMAGIFSIALLLPSRWRVFGEYALFGFVSIFFVLTSHSLSFFYGSSATPVNLSNYGTEYTYRYATKNDVLMGEWLAQHTKSDATISGDSLARDRMRLSLDPAKSQAMLNTVLPTALPRSSYVIRNTHANEVKAFDTYESKMVIYNFPTAFLNEKKNAIYSNTGGVVYR